MKICPGQMVNEKKIGTSGSKNLISGLRHSEKSRAQAMTQIWAAGDGKAAGNFSLPSSPPKKGEAFKWAKAKVALSSNSGLTEPKASVGGKGVLGFGLGFFHGYEELNYLTAVLLKWLLQKHSLSKMIIDINKKGSSFRF